MTLLALLFALVVSTPAAAEEACIKYHKCISLDQFKCADLTRSSFIERVCYNEPKRYMAIRLKGTYYHYCEIGPQAVSDLLSAPSAGKFYNENIKGGAFDCRDHPIPAF